MEIVSLPTNLWSRITEYLFREEYVILTQIHPKIRLNLLCLPNKPPFIQLKFNPAQTSSNITLSNQMKKAVLNNTNSDGSTAVCDIRLIKGRKYYYSFIVRAGDQGWTVGISKIRNGYDQWLSFTPEGYGYANYALLWHAGKCKRYAQAFTVNDEVGALINCQEGWIGFYKNGEYLGIAEKIPDLKTHSKYYPAISMGYYKGNCVEISDLRIFDFVGEPPKKMPLFLKK